MLQVADADWTLHVLRGPDGIRTKIKLLKVFDLDNNLVTQANRIQELQDWLLDQVRFNYKEKTE